MRWAMRNWMPGGGALKMLERPESRVPWMRHVPRLAALMKHLEVPSCSGNNHKPRPAAETDVR